MPIASFIQPEGPALLFAIAGLLALGFTLILTSFRNRDGKVARRIENLRGQPAAKAQGAKRKPEARKFPWLP